MMFVELAFLLPIIVTASSSSDDSGGSGFAYLFLASGFAFYGIIYARYRNAGQRHFHETETEANTQNEQGEDQYLQSLKGLSNSTMRGANHKSVKGALNT